MSESNGRAATEPLATIMLIDGAYQMLCRECGEPVISLHRHAIGLDCPPPCPHCPPFDWSAATVEVTAQPPASPSG